MDFRGRLLVGGKNEPYTDLSLNLCPVKGPLTDVRAFLNVSSSISHHRHESPAMTKSCELSDRSTHVLRLS